MDKQPRTVRRAAIALPLYHTPEGHLIAARSQDTVFQKSRRPGLNTLVLSSWQGFLSTMDRACYRAIHNYKASFCLPDRLGRMWRGFGGEINLDEDVITELPLTYKGDIVQDLGPSELEKGKHIYSLPSVAYTFRLRTPKGCDTFDHVYAFMDSLAKSGCILIMGPNPHVLNRCWPHLFERKSPREWSVTVASTMYIHCIPDDMLPPEPVAE